MGSVIVNRVSLLVVSFSLLSVFATGEVSLAENASRAWTNQLQSCRADAKKVQDFTCSIRWAKSKFAKGDNAKVEHQLSSRLTVMGKTNGSTEQVFSPYSYQMDNFTLKCPVIVDVEEIYSASVSASCAYVSQFDSFHEFCTTALHLNDPDRREPYLVSAHEIDSTRRSVCRAEMPAMTEVSRKKAKATSGPLFSNQVRKDIKEMGQQMKAFEQSLGVYVTQLDDHYDEYTGEGCKEKSDNSACRAKRGDIQDTYANLLDAAENGLPGLNKALLSVQSSLGGQIRARVGQGTNLGELYEELLAEKKSNKQQASKTVTKKKPSGRLSARFQKLYDLVAGSNQGDDKQLLRLALEVYMSVEDGLKIASAMEINIHNSRTHVELGRLENLMGIENEDRIEAILENIKGVLFGEEDDSDDGILPAPSRMELEQATDEEEGTPFSLEL